jgi:hypothetical protein
MTLDQSVSGAILGMLGPNVLFNRSGTLPDRASVAQWSYYSPNGLENIEYNA